MLKTINNEFLKLEIDTHGAEMQSIQGKDGIEYLWQGNKDTWPDKAINLFPYIGRLTEGTYSYRGKDYHMQIHGFAPYSEFTAVKQDVSSICFSLSANNKIGEVYPFKFGYSIEYKLVQSEIWITFKVENKDDKPMYFGVGGHPGFQIPIGGSGDFEDYYLEFAGESDAKRVGFSDTCFVNGKDEEFPFLDGVRLPLRHDLFDNDAIVLRDMSRKVTLKSDKTDKSITVEYPQMDYLGIWHWPKVEVGYVCIEPWSSLPSRDGIVEDIEKQENLICLEAGGTYENRWKIVIN